jgi:hypothetical protein
VPVVVTLHGPDGRALTTHYPELTIGEVRTISVPSAATTVALARPARTRVALAGRRTSPRARLVAGRPTWRDESPDWMVVQWWCAAFRGRRAIRRLRQQRGRADGGPRT